MSDSRLPNYLRMHRKRLGFETSTVAALIGSKVDDSVARHERFIRTPTLEIAFAYEAVFQISVDELFAGVRERALDAVQGRAVAMIQRMQASPRERLGKRQMAALRRIAGME